MIHVCESFKAWGHPNIRSNHRTTLMITKDAELTPRGDCVVALRAQKGLMDLDPSLKEAMRERDARIRLILNVNGLAFVVSGSGDPRLPLSHPTEMVARKSHYICGRTLMIGADKAACDLDDTMISLLRDEKRAVSVTIVVESVTQKCEK